MVTLRRTVAAPTASDLEAAAAAVAAALAPTPLLASHGIGGWLKLESFQPTGAFKVRGAVAALAAAAVGGGVVTASAGNHGLGVAWAAARLAVDAVVVVPATASAAKVAALRSYPVELVEHGDNYDAAEAHALAMADRRGLAYLSPYNDPHVIAGQASLGAEVAAQAAGPATVVVPIGGGGLAAGVGLALATRPDLRVIGVEAAASTAVAAAVHAGGVVPVDVGPTIADGMAGNIEPGSVTVELVARHVDGLVTVTEDEITAAMRWLCTAHGLVAEGAGAAATAAVLAGDVPSDRPVVAVLSGRSITPAQLAAVLSPGERAPT